MRLSAIVAVGLMLLPAAAHAQSNDPAAQAQQRFRALVEGAGKLNTRFVVGSDPDPCFTAYGSISAGQSVAQALDTGFAIDWRRVKSIAYVPGNDTDPWWRDYVTVLHVNGRSNWPLHPTPEKVGPLLAAGNELIRLCKGRRPRIGQMPIGREFQVTADMVWINDEDAFLRYYYEAKLIGRRGDRFRIAWRGTEAVNLGYDDGYQAEYPKNASIFDKSSSVTITLLRDGEQILSFDESGAGFRNNGSSGSLAGPSMEGRYKKPFAPFYMTVQKLN